MTNGYARRLRYGLGLQQLTGWWTNRFIYDLARRLTNVASPAGTFSYTHTYVGALPSAGSLIQKLSLPGGLTITNDFDALARLKGTWLMNGGTTLNAHGYSLNAGNQRTQQTFSAGSTYNYSYDAIGQLKVADSATSSEDRGYQYDASWNLHPMRYSPPVAHPSDSPVQSGIMFGRDSGPLSHGVNYRTNNTTLQTFTVNGKNELTSAPSPYGSMSYDNNGNLVVSHGTARLYEYDDENQLVAVQRTAGLHIFKTTFTYDGKLRLRLLREYQWEESPPEFTQGEESESGTWTLLSETRYVYDGMLVIQERNGGNTPTVTYTRGNDLSGSREGAGGIGGLLARSHGYSSGNWSTHNFYHADGNGNVTYLVDSSQSLAASYRYDPFGNTISSSGSLASANTYRFSSKMIHANTGLYYYGYRWYIPDVQRWGNRDPVEEYGGLNLYCFVYNEPPRLIDGMGLTPCVEGWGGKIWPPFVGPGLPSQGNCFRFACGDKPKFLEPHDPLFPGANPFCDDPCKSAMDGLTGSGMKPVPPSGICPFGQHKITIQFSPDTGRGKPDFHFSRQCPDGSWWDKPGVMEPRPVNGPDDTLPSYKKCGELCVPHNYNVDRR